MDADREITFDDLSVADQLRERLFKLLRSCIDLRGSGVKPNPHHLVCAGDPIGRIVFEHDGELNAVLRELCDGIGQLRGNPQALRQAMSLSLGLAVLLLSRIPPGGVDLGAAIDSLCGLRTALDRLEEGRLAPVLEPPTRPRGRRPRVATMYEHAEPTKPSAVAKALKIRCCATIYALEQTGLSTDAAIGRVRTAGAAAATAYLGGYADRRLPIRKIENWWKGHRTGLRKPVEDERGIDARDAVSKATHYALLHGLGWELCSRMLLGSLSKANITRPLVDVAKDFGPPVRTPRRKNNPDYAP